MTEEIIQVEYFLFIFLWALINCIAIFILFIYFYTFLLLFTHLTLAR